MELYPEVVEYRAKHPRCRFCFYSNFPGLFEEKCSIKNSLPFPKFLQPLTCRFVSFTRLETVLPLVTPKITESRWLE